jgi:hypothetical protein
MTSVTRKYRNLYGRAAWEGVNGMSKTVLRHNPLCQRIIDGQQCLQPATDVHHLCEHNGDPAKFFDWSQVVAVCKSCHFPGEGDPGYQYSPTMGLDHARYVHDGVEVDWTGQVIKGAKPVVLGYSSIRDILKRNKRTQ